MSCGTEVRSLAVGLGGGSLEFVLPEGGARQDQHQYKKYLELNGLDLVHCATDSEVPGSNP